MFRRLTERNEWKFFAVLPRADRGLALIWWIMLILRGVLPAMFAIAMGLVVGSVEGGGGMGGVPLLRRRRLRVAPDPHANPPGGWHQPWRSYRGLAL